jgi:hypothetical protein
MDSGPGPPARGSAWAGPEYGRRRARPARMRGTETSSRADSLRRSAYGADECCRCCLCHLAAVAHMAAAFAFA